MYTGGFSLVKSVSNVWLTASIALYAVQELARGVEALTVFHPLLKSANQYLSKPALMVAKAGSEVFTAMIMPSQPAGT